VWPIRSILRNEEGMENSILKRLQEVLCFKLPPFSLLAITSITPSFHSGFPSSANEDESDGENSQKEGKYTHIGKRCLSDVRWGGLLSCTKLFLEAAECSKTRILIMSFRTFISSLQKKICIFVFGCFLLFGSYELFFSHTDSARFD